MTAKTGSFVIHWKRPDKRVVEMLTSQKINSRYV